jgi:hypothetical protein
VSLSQALGTQSVMYHHSRSEPKITPSPSSQTPPCAVQPSSKCTSRRSPINLHLHPHFEPASPKPDHETPFNTTPPAFRAHSCTMPWISFDPAVWADEDATHPPLTPIANQPLSEREKAMYPERWETQWSCIVGSAKAMFHRLVERCYGGSRGQRGIVWRGERGVGGRG